MPARNRPLSPHLQIYRWKLHMAMSIMHRATGVALAFGLLAFSAFLVAAASSGSAYDAFMACVKTPLGMVVAAGFAFALIYHGLNGVRHLNWDTGRGLSKEQAQRSGVIVVVLSLVLTAAIIAYGLRAMGQI